MTRTQATAAPDPEVLRLFRELPSPDGEPVPATLRHGFAEFIRAMDARGGPRPRWRG